MAEPRGALFALRASGKVGGHRRGKVRRLEAEVTKHTDLTDKEVAGVIDHADESVTADKLVTDLDASGIGFDADLLDGFHAATFIALPGFWKVIEEVVLGAGAGDITFDSIPASYKHLHIIAEMISTSNGHLRVQFNDDTTATYNYLRINLATGYFGGSSSGQNYVEAVNMFYANKGTYAEMEFNNSVAGQAKGGVLKSARGANSYGITPFEWQNSSDKIAKIKLFLGSGIFKAGSAAWLMGK